MIAKAGDRVAIMVAVTPLKIGHEGVVKYRDGSYLYVVPDGFHHEVELYDCEVQRV